MAEKKKRRVVKKSETVREKTERKVSESNKKPRTIAKAKSKVGETKSKLGSTGRKEYYLPFPSNSKFGKWLNKPRSIVPGFIRNSWQELKGVTWPNRSETFSLSVAVLLFAIFFGGLIAGIDYVLDNVIRRVILGL